MYSYTESQGKGWPGVKGTVKWAAAGGWVGMLREFKRGRGGCAQACRTAACRPAAALPHASCLPSSPMPLLLLLLLIPLLIVLPVVRPAGLHNTLDPPIVLLSILVVQPRSLRQPMGIGIATGRG